jgi:hypothetical protein
VAAFVMIFSQAAHAGGFYDFCARALPIAEKFASDCRAHARPFRRVFIAGGVELPESLAFYQSPDLRDGHFSLGCTLGSNREIRFIGIIWAPRPETFNIGNSAPFAFVDFNGNVGLRVGDEIQYILRIRSFKVKGARSLTGVTDCAGGSFSETRLPHPRADVTYKALNDGAEIEIRKCIYQTGGVTECYPTPYLNPRNAKIKRIIREDAAILIDEEGQALISASVLPRLCEAKRLRQALLLETSGAIQEFCD